MFNKNGKNYMVKNIWQHCKQIWTHCFFVVSYNIVSYYRFLNTDPGAETDRASPSAAAFTTPFNVCAVVGRSVFKKWKKLLFLKVEVEENIFVLKAH
jgi:hypothetical protein